MADCVYPWWAGLLLSSPLRRLSTRPEDILGPYVRPDTTALDFGCGMGFFSLPLARMLGPEGKVYCVDVQRRMLYGLSRRARRAGLAGRIETRLCGPDSIGAEDLLGAVDFALVFHVLHELPDGARFLDQLAALVAPGGRALVRESRGRMPPPVLERAADEAALAGFEVSFPEPEGREASLLLAKPRAPGACPA